MARKPKPTSPIEASAHPAKVELPALDEAPIPARRGRPPKSTETSPPPAAAEDDGAAATDVADAGGAGDDARGTSFQKRQGRKPKPSASVTASLSLDKARRAGAEVDSDPKVAEPAAKPEEAALPPEAAAEDEIDDGSDANDRNAAEGKPADKAATTLAVSGSTAPSKPAAHWDRATDTVQFDWAEIERTASRDGPNQVMAKLLVAARAEGAHSRWPL